MKKYLLLTGASLLVANMFAQQVVMPKTHKIENAKEFKTARFANQQSTALKNSNAITTGFIDYSWQNFNDASFVWQFSSNFTAIDTAINYVGVALTPFQGIFDYADQELDFNFAYPNTYTYTVDSIFALLTHENNSGDTNLVVMQLVQTGSTGALTAGSTVKWADTILTTTSLSPGGNWLGSNARYTAGFAPNYTTTAGAKMGMVLRYYGPNTDSLGVLGSFVDDGTGEGTTTQSPSPTSYMQLPPNISQIVPNRVVGFGSPVGSEGWLPAQDWEIWAKVTFNDITGISDAELNKTATLYQNVPNPSKGTTLIKYDLAKSATVSIAFYDITGKKVKEVSEGEKNPGNYQVRVGVEDLSKGVYFYKLKTSNGVELTKKMVISE